MIKTMNGYIEVEGGKVYYETAGIGTPVVLAHAGFVDNRMWDDQWAALAEQYRVVRFDMRGFGKSDPLQAPVSRRADLQRVLDQLGLAQATLIGCSLGGEMILDFALEQPERALALVVISTAPSGFQLQGEPPRDLLEMFGALQNGDLARASELQNRIWLDGPFREPGQVDAALRQRVTEMSRLALEKGAWSQASLQPLNPLDPPAVTCLASIHVPVLIVAGALDHPEILRAADTLSAAIPGAREFISPECAHLPNLEKPHEFNQQVIGFLQSVLPHATE